MNEEVMLDAIDKDKSGKTDTKSIRIVILVALFVPLGYFVPGLNFLAWISVVGLVGIMFLINAIWFVSIDKWRALKKEHGIETGLKLKKLGQSILLSGSIVALLYFCGWPVAAALYAFNVVSFNILYRL